METGSSVYRAEVAGDFVVYRAYLVIKGTPNGGYIVVEGSEKLIRDESRFASSTKRGALKDLRARKAAYVRHTTRKLNIARRHNMAAKDGKERPSG